MENISSLVDTGRENLDCFIRPSIIQNRYSYVVFFLKIKTLNFELNSFESSGIILDNSSIVMGIYL